MTIPNETGNDFSTSAAEHTSSELIDELGEIVARNPAVAALASAAAGAALIAITALVTRGPRRKVRRVAQRASEQVSGAAQRASEQATSRFEKARDEYAAMKAAAQRASEQASAGVDRARDEYASLRSQIGDIAKMVAAAIPSKRDASKAIDSVGEKLGDSWQGVREQAQDLLDQARPQVEAAADLARRNPVWTAVAIGTIGAIVGSQLLRGRDDDDMIFRGRR